MKTLPSETIHQLYTTTAIIAKHLSSCGIDTVHLFGSAVDGGLKPYSDIDLLVTVRDALSQIVRQSLMKDLLTVSAPPGCEESLRALEVTVLVRREVVPWQHPARRELQFGEWLRQDIEAGFYEPAIRDPDLAILLTKAREHSMALQGPPAAAYFDPVPQKDFFKALASTVAQWNAPPDWQGDERNVVLALARILYSTMTGQIASKEVAAEWALQHSMLGDESVLRTAREAYLGTQKDDLSMRPEQVTSWILSTKTAIEKALGKSLSD